MFKLWTLTGLYCWEIPQPTILYDVLLFCSFLMMEWCLWSYTRAITCFGIHIQGTVLCALALALHIYEQRNRRSDFKRCNKLQWTAPIINCCKCLIMENFCLNVSLTWNAKWSISGILALSDIDTKETKKFRKP